MSAPATPVKSSAISSSSLPLLGLIVCSASLASAHAFARLSYAYDVNVLTAASARLTCAVVAFFVAGELLSVLQIIGALIVVTAVMGYQVSVRRR